jgi:hypothetical protein
LFDSFDYIQKFIYRERVGTLQVYSTSTLINNNKYNLLSSNFFLLSVCNYCVNMDM